MFRVETVNMESVAVVCLCFSHVSDFSVECGPELKTHRIFLVVCTVIQLSLFLFIISYLPTSPLGQDMT